MLGIQLKYYFDGAFFQKEKKASEGIARLGIWKHVCNQTKSIEYP